MSALTRAAVRLADGSGTVRRRLKKRTANWIARGRRHDLTGWRAALGCWLRLLILTAGLYALGRIVRALPALMWLLAGWWVVAAWRTGHPAPAEAPADNEPEAPARPDPAAVRRLLLDVMGDADTVHLRTVLARLQKHGQWEGRTVGDLRAHLEALGIPVHPKVKAPGGGPTRGVRRADLAPSPGPAAGPSTEASTAA